MEDIKSIVAQNILKYRRKEGLSLGQLSELTNVSKTMLNQIEKGDSNPSITILWRISSGLKVPLSQLISTQNRDIEVIDKSSIQAMYNSDKTTAIYPYFLYKNDRPFELFQTELQPNSSLKPESHHQESTIYLLVTEGCLNITINDKEYKLSKDQAIKFSSDFHHEYVNNTEEKSVFVSILHYEI